MDSNNLEFNRIENFDVLPKSEIAALYASRHKELLENLSKKVLNGEKIKIGFICHDVNKWRFTSLYNQFIKDERFSVPEVILIHALGLDSEVKINNYISHKEYLKNLNYQVVDGYCQESLQAKSEIYKNFDIVFYSDPNMTQYSAGHVIENISWDCLSCYIPYGFFISGNDDYGFSKKSYLCNWRWYLESSSMYDAYFSHSGRYRDNAKFVGSTMHDLIIESNNEPRSISSVVYAPHWTNAEKWGLFEYGTFAWSAKAILQIAKLNPNTTFYYRPHPLLHISIIEGWDQAGKISKEFYTQFLAEFLNLSNVVDISNIDYIEYFNCCDLLILDSVSFMAEFFKTHKPVILLRRENSFYSKLGQIIASTYYQVYSPEELISAYEMLLTGEDPLHNYRSTKYKQLFGDDSQAASEKIYSDICYQLKIN